MKKTVAIFLLFTFCLSLCACSLTPDAEVVYIPAEDTPGETQPVPDNTVSEADAADAEAAKMLCGIMEELYADYHPGTAGSSLTLAALSGRLLDWYEQSGSVGAISKAAAAFAVDHEDYAALDESSEISVGFPASLADAWRCAADMSFPGGDEILESAGYTRSTEWEPAQTEAFFTRLFSAFGLEEPQSVKLYYGRVASVRFPAEVNEYSLMAALRTAGVINSDTQLTAFIHDEDHLALDFGSEIIPMLNSLDDSGEHYALSCIVCTFLDAFDAEDITLTVDGKPLATDRVTYDFAITRSDV